MTNVTGSLFSQILGLFSRGEFEGLARKHGAERHARGFSCWTQLVAMLFCQLGRAHSLREICFGLAAIEGKLSHLGLQDAPKRSTLSYANEHRPWQLYRDVFQQLYQRCASTAIGRGRKFKFKNKLISMDSTLVQMSLALYDWAKYTRAKGAIKLHMLLDHDGYLPQFAVLTDGKKSDISVALKIRFEPGTIVIFDRGYYRFGWWLRLARAGVFFVSRLKDNAQYDVVRENPVEPGSAIRKDQVIVMKAQKRCGTDAHFRRIEYWSEEQQQILVFITNHHALPAQTIADIYRERWQIELFFESSTWCTPLDVMEF